MCELATVPMCELATVPMCELATVPMHRLFTVPMCRLSTVPLCEATRGPTNLSRCGTSSSFLAPYHSHYGIVVFLKCSFDVREGHINLVDELWPITFLFFISQIFSIFLFICLKKFVYLRPSP
ncbi:hypothetical protein AVEN_76658-1 [Araneus ventricosus]|uniref:Uncharacterized protein n=1 Tax=Araneus ventricosus TaxID=182803 RepID=A0A4Y2BNW3_ARAVE|nr:hypothetical protein AVEN_76658-1 [Araneus ventricosus]